MRYPLLQSARWSDLDAGQRTRGWFGTDSDTWFEGVAPDGVSTAFLDASDDGPPVVRRNENKPLSTAAIE
jgi:hypothetical protein